MTSGTPGTLPASGLGRRLPMAVRPWIGGVLISFSAVWVRLADVEVTRSALLRGAYALPFLGVLLVLDRRRTVARAMATGDPARVRWVLPLGVLAGVFLGIDLIAWHASIAIVGAGLGAVFPNLQVLIVGLAGVVLFRERPSIGYWLSLPLVLAGVTILGVVGRPVSANGSMVLGIAYGTVTAITYGLSLVVLRIARQRTPEGNGVVVLFSMTLGSTIVTGIIALTQGVAGPAGWPADGWLLLLALGSQVIGWMLLTSSIAHLPAALTSVALLLQPAFAMLWGRLILGEPVGPYQVGGAMVLLAGIVVAQRSLTTAALRGALMGGDPPGPPARTVA